MKHVLTVFSMVLSVLLALACASGWWLYTLYEDYQQEAKAYALDLGSVNQRISDLQTSIRLSESVSDVSRYDALVQSGYIGSASRVTLLDAIRQHTKGFWVTNAQVSLMPWKALTAHHLAGRFTLPSSVRYESVMFEANFTDDVDALAWLTGVQGLAEMKMTVLNRCQFKRTEMPMDATTLSYPLWLQCQWSLIDVPTS